MFLTMVISLSCIIFTPIISWYIYWYTITRRIKHVPGPTPWPIIGNANLFPDSKSFLNQLISLINEHGPLVKLIIGLEPSITIADYETLESVLSSRNLIDKATIYRHFHNWLGEGLLTSTGNKWRKRRKILTPTYHFQILEQFVPIFQSVGDVLIGELKKCPNKENVDIYPFITLCALDVICETAMGTSVNAQINKDCDYVLSVKEICKIIMDKTFRPLQQNSLLYRFSDNYKREMKCLSVLNKYTNSVIKKRREELINANVDSVGELRGRQKVAFLDLLLNATIDGKALTDEDIREEVATFMFEGHDTTASAMSFALYCIANDRNVQEKIVQEQLVIFGKDREKVVTYRDLSEMKYLEMVIKETLRLYPSVPFYAREAKKNFKISNEMIIPKGFIVNIFAYGIQRDPKYFPDPDKFDPDRFLPENQLGKSPYSFIPFSAGLRNCIGQKFAMLEMKATISNVLRHFELSAAVPRHKLELISETILKSANGILINMEERMKWKA